MVGAREWEALETGRRWRMVVAREMLGLEKCSGQRNVGGEKRRAEKCRAGMVGAGGQDKENPGPNRVP
jgi:hypothetical protein